MARSDSPLRRLLRMIVEQLRVHARVIIPAGAAVMVGVVVVGFLTVVYAVILGRVAYAQLMAFASSPDRASIVSVLLILPIALLTLVVGFVWAGTTVQLANAAISARRISTGGAALTSFRTFPSATLVLLVVIAAVLAAMVTAPVLVLSGIVGLLLNTRTQRWSRATLITMAVPFGVAVVLLLRWSLALPSVWLAGSKLRPALADSAQRTRGRMPVVALVVVLSAAVSYLATEGLVAVVGNFHVGSIGDFVTRLIALILVGPLLPVAFALQYRAGGPPPPTSPAVEARTSRRARIAVAVTVSMVLPFMATANPSPAAAVGSTAATVVIGTVDAQPLPVGTPTIINFSVINAVDAEAVPPSGEFSISIDGTPLTGTFALGGHGSVYQLSQTFADGSHLIQASYPGDGTYASASASLTVQVGTAPPPPPAVDTTTAFTLSPSSPSPAGGTVTAHVSVSANVGTDVPTGTVGVYLNDQNQPPLAEKTLVAGQADVDFTVPPGANHVVVYYTADAGFNNSQNDDTQYVSKYTPTVAINANSGSVYGAPLALSATVTAGVTPTGSVTFDVNTPGGGFISVGPAALNGSGVATASASGMPLGLSSVIAHYSGDTSVAAADSATFDHTVSTASVDVQVSQNLVSPSFGDSATQTVTVTAASPATGTPTGTVTLQRDDGATFGPTALTFAGTATFSAGLGSAGDHSFSASYSGDANFAPGNGSLDFTVAKATTTTTLASVPGPGTVYGDTVTFNGTVSATSGSAPTGVVQLWAGTQEIASGVPVFGNFSISTNRMPAGTSTDVWAVYVPDDDHSGSDSTRQQMTVTKAAPALALSVSDDTVTIGDTVTLTADLANLGAGPTGTVSFTNLSTNPDTVLGTPTIVGHTATLTFVVSDTAMQIVAAYAGDGNFTGETSATLAVTANPVTPTITLAPVGAVEYGTLVTLTATVTPVGLNPAGNVQFRTSSNDVLGTVVPDSAGHATLSACAGESGACPGATVFLGSGDLNLTARFLPTAINYQADSASVPYSITDAATTTVVSINPVTVDVGAGIYLTATVHGVTSLATPSGYVVFSASMPNGLGGFGDAVIANQNLDSTGVATYFATAGTGSTDIRWPAAAITARYVPIPNTKFHASNGSTPITVRRFGLTLSATVPGTVSILTPTPVTVLLNREAGSSTDYTELVTVTPDVGAPCTATVPSGTTVTSCNITWSTTGAHSVTVSYPGDLTYEAATSAAIPVNIGIANPNLIPLASSTAVAQTDFTVTWNLFNLGATGTITVWGDGTLWCTVPLATQTCTGQFGTASATGSPVDVVVRYSGDANWGPAEIHKLVLVKRCVIPDVHSADSSMGTVQITTVSNCGVGGYLTGTQIVATATPISPNLFVNWKKLGGVGYILDTTSPTTIFTLTTDSTTWVREATFSRNCYPVTADVTGHGGISVYPATNCTTVGGVAGYAPGTAITVYPDTAYNSYYGEQDAFYFFGTVAGAEIGKDSSARVRLKATVTGDLTIPVTFGPQCRSMHVIFDPASTGDAGTVATPENCQSPEGNGFVRFTPVTVHAVPGDSTLAISGWLLNGVAQPTWGTASDQNVVIDKVVPQLTVQLVHCYKVDVKIDGAQDAQNRDVGTVNVSPEPNCPDGSKRYLGGSSVTMTPEILVDGGAFNGWDTARIQPVKSPDGKGVLTNQARVVDLSADLETTAGFFFKDTCSSLQIIDNLNVFTMDDDGCGQGQYFDLQKQFALRDGESPESHTSDSDRSELTAHINPNIPLDVFLSVQGDTGTCFDKKHPSAAAGDVNAWKTYGPLKGDVHCAVGGPIQIQAATCQTLTSTLELTVDGDKSGTIYGRNVVPSTLYLPGADGKVGAFDANSFVWMQSAAVTQVGGKVKIANYGDDPCTRNGPNTYPSGRNIALYGLGLTSGFTFAGWSNIDPAGPVAQNPVLTETTVDSRTQEVYPRFTVSCHHLSLGEGLYVVGDAPYCPGSKPSDYSFIAGTAVQVNALALLGDRVLTGFKSGVVAGQISEDPDTKVMTSFVVVDSDKSVTAEYPTKTEAIGRAIVQGLKIVSGILAVVAPIALGMLFPPAGIFFGFLSAAAGIASLIKPGGAEVAGVLDLINPTKITTCAARWAFSNAGNPTGGLGVGGIISTANTLRKVYNGVDVVFEGVGPVGLGGSALSLGYGLYDAGIGHADLSPQSVDQLRGTSTMTGCLDEQWRIAGSNVSGTH